MKKLIILPLLLLAACTKEDTPPAATTSATNSGNLAKPVTIEIEVKSNHKYPYFQFGIKDEAPLKIINKGGSPMTIVPFKYTYQATKSGKYYASVLTSKNKNNSTIDMLDSGVIWNAVVVKRDTVTIYNDTIWDDTSDIVKTCQTLFYFNL